ncbi:MAG: sugar-transfer associated ATP-grasp domain-containing protein [Candidatus Omnitrophota bacterium]
MSFEHAYRIESFVTRLRRTPWGLKLQEKLFERQLPLLRPVYRAAFCRYKECSEKKPLSQIKKEMSLCKKYWGCHPTHYLLYDLYRADQKLSEGQLINYIPHYFFLVLFWEYHNSAKKDVLVNDKLIEEQYFRSLGIAQPVTLCKLINRRLYTNELKPTSFAAVNQAVAEGKFRKIFIKPRQEHCARGIYILNKTACGRYVSKNNESWGESLLQKIAANNDYIIQPGLDQVEAFSKIYPHSVNTLRIVTENKGGDVRIVCALLRMGRGGEQVDNAGQGGIFVRVDLETGAVAEQARSLTCGYFRAHPDTGFIFTGFTVAEWRKIKEFVLAAAEKTVDFPYLGWDVAVTKDAIVALEALTAFSIELCQIACGGMRELLGIEDIRPYWKNR